MLPEEPLTPLNKVLSIGKLLEEAAKEIPELSDEGVSFGVKITQSEFGFIGTVKVNDFSGKLIGAVSKTGEKSLLGVIEWKF